MQAVQVQSESKQAARQAQEFPAHSMLVISPLARALVPQQVKPSRSAQAQADSAARQSRSLPELSRRARAPVPQLASRSELVEPPELEWAEPPHSELAFAQSD
jgi:hypothetical protein